MALVEFSMSPLDRGESLGRYVARVVDLVDRSGLAYRLNPMGTVVEGELGEVLDLIKRCHHELERDCGRISTAIKIDYRRGKSGRLEGKLESVERHLGRSVKR